LQGPIVTGDVSGMIGVWRSASNQAVVKLLEHKAPISSLDISADGNWLAAGSSDGDVTLLNLGQERLPMVRLRSDGGPVTFVRMDSTGRWLASGHEEGSIALWDLRQAKLLVSESNSSVDEPNRLPSPRATLPSSSGREINARRQRSCNDNPPWQ
jgi:WD40 repeat protein